MDEYPRTAFGNRNTTNKTQQDVLQAIADALGGGRGETGGGGGYTGPSPGRAPRGSHPQASHGPDVLEGTGEIAPEREYAEYGGPTDMGLGLAREQIGSELPLRMDEELTQPSEAERALQTLLNAAGFQVDTDGFAGPQTIGALNEFLASVAPRESEFAPGDVIDGYILDLLRQVSD